MNVKVQPTITQPSPETVRHITATLVEVVLAAQGPLGVKEISAISNVAESDIRRWAEGYADEYEWLIVLLCREMLKKNDAEYSKQKTLGEINEALFTESARNDLHRLLAITAKLHHTSIAEDEGRLGQVLGPELLAQRHVCGFLSGLEGEEAHAAFARHLAMLQYATHFDYWALLLDNMPEGFPITPASFRQYVTNKS